MATEGVEFVFSCPEGGFLGSPAVTKVMDVSLACSVITHCSTDFCEVKYRKNISSEHNQGSNSADYKFSAQLQCFSVQ